MTPAFSSWQAFFAMSGYGFFVWSAALITLISLSGLMIHTILRRQKLLAEIKRRQLRQQRIEQAKLTKEGVRS